MSRWFRYYDDALNDPKVQRLPGDLFKAWVNILCVAAKNGGLLPSVEDVAFGLRTSPAKAGAIVAELARDRLLDPVVGGYFRPHNWDGRQFKSDVSTDRVREFRERQTKREGNVSYGASASAPEQNTADHKQNQSRHEGNNFEGVKEKGWKPPRHGTVQKVNGVAKRVYINSGTPEWNAYAESYREVHKREPIPNAHGGKWFKWSGEAE